MTKFEAPKDLNKNVYPPGDEPAEPEEPVADRVGDFTAQVGAHTDAADAQPSHEELLIRQGREELTPEEKEAGLKAVTEAKRIIAGQEDSDSKAA